MINEYICNERNWRNPFGDETDPCCASCGWGSRQTERCALCMAEQDAPARGARLLLPALAHMMRARLESRYDHATVGLA